MFEMFPLSPVREWATSRNFVMLHLLVKHLYLDIISWDQNGSNGKLLGDVYPHASASGGSVGVERFYLIADVLRLGTRCGARRHAQTNLRTLLPVRSDGPGKRIFIQRVDPDIIHAPFLDRHPPHSHPLLRNLAG